MCPVMIIPEGCSYKPIRQIAFAYDPDTNPLFLVDQLRSFAEVLGTSVKVVHVVEDARSDENDHKLQLIEASVMARAHKQILWTFEGLYGRDVAWKLWHHAVSNDIDVLALSYHHRSLMDKLLHQNVIKRISMTAEFPVFIFWK